MVKTAAPAEAEGEIAVVYADEVASMGCAMQATQCWLAKPDILAPVKHLLHHIRDGFSLGLINFRRITLIAANPYHRATALKSISRRCRNDRGEHTLAVLATTALLA